MYNELKEAFDNTNASDTIVLKFKDKTIELTREELDGYYNPNQIVTSKTGLNLRLKPGLKQPIVARIPFGSGVLLMSNQIVNKDEHTWMNAKYNGKIGWLAAEYIDDAPIPAPSSTFKFGLHVYPFDKDLTTQNERLYGVAERLYNLKRPMSFTVMDIGQAQRLAPYSKFMIFRPYIPSRIDISDNEELAELQGEGWARMYYDLYKDAPSKSYIQLTNEGDNCDHKHKNFGAFYLGILKTLDKFSRKGVAFNDAVGNPEFIHIQQRSKCLDYIRRNNHVIGYHAYSKRIDDNNDLQLTNPDHDNIKNYAKRWEWLYTGDLKIVINEAGRYNAKFISIQDTVEDMKKYNDMIKNDKRILCVNWWQYNGQGDYLWDKSAINSALDDIEKMIKD